MHISDGTIVRLSWKNGDSIKHIAWNYHWPEERIARWVKNFILQEELELRKQWRRYREEVEGIED